MLVFKEDFTDNLGALLPTDRNLKFYYVMVILQKSTEKLELKQPDILTRSSGSYMPLLTPAESCWLSATK